MEGPIVLDSSFLMAWCFGDEASDLTRAVQDRVADSRAHVPAHWHFEVANVLSMSERRRWLTWEQAEEFLKLLECLSIIVDEASIRAAFRETASLSRRHRLTIYDAAYLELSLRLELPLATLDRELIAAATKEGISVVTE